MRIVFMGTPEFAVPTLAEIVGQGHEVAAVYTRAPAPAHRGMALTKSPVHQLAERLGLQVAHPLSLRSEEAQAEFRAHQAEIAVVVAYGMILPKPVLEAPSLYCLNLHGSLLPRWRGAAPIQRAVMEGDAETGVMVMRIEEGLDAGPVAMAERVAIRPDDTAGDLHDRLMKIGADLMVRALAAASRGALTFTPQAEAGITYAKKIDKAETRIDWSRPARAVHDHIRGLSPFPGAWFEADGQRIKALRSTRVGASGAPGTVLDDALTIACGEGAVRLTELQRAGKGPMEAAAFLRGTHVPAGTLLD